MAKSYMIDRDGKPYIENESYPVGGGLDRRCSYNTEALCAFYNCKNREECAEYLKKNGFSAIHDEIWEKGDTRIYFDGDINDDVWGYITTEYIGGMPTMVAKNEVLVDAFITKKDIEKAMQVLVDNGIEEDEADIVLQAIGYALIGVELFNE